MTVRVPGRAGRPRSSAASVTVFTILVLLVLGLYGCARLPAGPDAGLATVRAGVVTESDEPLVRKRARIRTELASAYFQQDQTLVALDEVKQALLIDPDFAAALSLRGLIYFRLNEAVLAEESFRRALLLNPRDADAAHNLGWLLCTQSRHDEAQSLFARALAVPGYAAQAKTWMAQGLCQIQAGQRSAGQQSLARALEIDPDNAPAAYNLALLLYDRGELAPARVLLMRLNDGAAVSAQSLWLAVQVERKLDNSQAAAHWGQRLRAQFGQSREAMAFDKGALND